MIVYFILLFPDGNAGKKKIETEKTERMKRKESREYSGILAQAQNELETNLYSVGKVKPIIHVVGPHTK